MCSADSVLLRFRHAGPLKYTEECHGLCTKMLFKALNEIRRLNPRTTDKGIERNVYKYHYVTMEENPQEENGWE